MRLCIKNLSVSREGRRRRTETLDPGGRQCYGVFATTQMNYEDPLETFGTLREARDFMQDECLARDDEPPIFGEF